MKRRHCFGRKNASFFKAELRHVKIAAGDFASPFKFLLSFITLLSFMSVLTL
jgi:hypothetical protein